MHWTRYRKMLLSPHKFEFIFQRHAVSSQRLPASEGFNPRNFAKETCAHDQETLHFNQPQRPAVGHCRVAGLRVIQVPACRLFRNIRLPNRERAITTV